MIFKCLLGHNELEIEVSGTKYKYCRKCGSLWFLDQVYFTTKNPDSRSLKGFKAWREILSIEKKKDFKEFLKSIGEIK